MLPYLLPDPDLIVFDGVDVDEETSLITCRASVTQETAMCPLCMQPAEKPHSGYERTLADLPWAGIPVRLELHVRRFFCKNPVCPRKIFCERIPAVAAPWARRTERMAHAQQAIGLATGGSGGKKLCTALSMDAGIDLLLTLIRSMEPPDRPTPVVLGVDDWAKRKGQTYGTILVDLEQGYVVDLLPDRSAETLAEWLRAHPEVEIVSRDRAGAYAQGAREGAPDAIQVADRWHLLKNLTDAVYKALQQHQSAIERKLTEEEGEQTTALEPVQLPVQDADTCDPSPADRARQQRAEEAHRLHREKWTNKEIAHHLGVSAKTISRYLQMELPIPVSHRPRRGSSLDPYKPYLLERWNAGCHNAAQLCREIQAQGFPGRVSIVREYVAELRKASGLAPGQRSVPGEYLEKDPSRRPPSMRALAFLIGRPPEKLDESEEVSLNLLSQVHPQIETTIRLARQFAQMVRKGEIENFASWLEEALHCKVPPLRSFASGLQQDRDAVEAALSLPWSNGPTEGHVNRLKSLKRQMYGRAKLDLLRQRMLAA